MAQEVGESRIWGGIHTRTADAHADMIGQRVAEYGFANYLRPATQAN